MVTTMHSASAQPANLPPRPPGDGFVPDLRTGRRPDGATADADPCVDGVVSRVPYPTLDQVAGSVAIQRLQWLRHLPAPRTTAEHAVFQRIRALGWSAPG
jgi:hypothetical protein